jgi:hypothetical protein
MKIQFLVAGASLLFVCGLVLSISDDRYVADAAIEIGVGGFHRELSLSEPVDLINDFGRQIEAVEDLLYILDVKYGIERGKRPRLVHRIAKTQRIQYANVIMLTVEADSGDEALTYLSEIVEWIVTRHDRLFRARIQRVERYRQEVLEAIKAGGCFGEEVEGGPVSVDSLSRNAIPWCKKENTLRKLKKSLIVGSLDSISPSRRSEILLSPIIRRDDCLTLTKC